MKMSVGSVFDIQRFSVHDGPAIRTTVFLAGCPLRCRWCHNPEGMTSARKLRFDSSQCAMCGLCSVKCPHDCHIISDGNHYIDRKGCYVCGKCTECCPAGALSIAVRQMTHEEVTRAVLRDLPFYGNGGGITLSGGEPLMQADFTADCLKECMKHGISTALDTCGCVPRKSIDKVLPFTNHFLYDIKAVTDSVHLSGTGMSNEAILGNCRYLSQAGTRLHIRVPVIGTFNANDDEITHIAEFLASLPSCPDSVTLIPYHTLGREKYGLFGICSHDNSHFGVSDSSIDRFRKIMKSYGLPVLK